MFICVYLRIKVQRLYFHAPNTHTCVLFVSWCSSSNNNSVLDYVVLCCYEQSTTLWVTCATYNWPYVQNLSQHAFEDMFQIVFFYLFNLKFPEYPITKIYTFIFLYVDYSRSV